MRCQKCGIAQLSHATGGHAHTIGFRWSVELRLETGVVGGMNGRLASRNTGAARQPLCCMLATGPNREGLAGVVG